MKKITIWIYPLLHKSVSTYIDAIIIFHWSFWFSWAKTFVRFILHPLYIMPRWYCVIVYFCGQFQQGWPKVDFKTSDWSIFTISSLLLVENDLVYFSSIDSELVNFESQKSYCPIPIRQGKIKKSWSLLHKKITSKNKKILKVLIKQKIILLRFIEKIKMQPFNYSTL